MVSASYTSAWTRFSADLDGTAPATSPAMARAAGRMSSQVCLKNARGTPSRPGVFEAAPRMAFLISASLGGSASFAAQSKEDECRAKPDEGSLGPLRAEGLSSEVSCYSLRV